jgi:hypothetical protein
LNTDALNQTSSKESMIFFEKMMANYPDLRHQRFILFQMTSGRSVSDHSRQAVVTPKKRPLPDVTPERLSLIFLWFYFENLKKVTSEDMKFIFSKDVSSAPSFIDFQDKFHSGQDDIVDVVCNFQCKRQKVLN